MASKAKSGGVRRYQNPDGTLTPEGRRRYEQLDYELKELKGYAKNPSGLGKSRMSTAIRNRQIQSLEKQKNSLTNRKSRQLTDGQKKALKIAGATAIAAGTAYVAYKVYKNGGIGNKKVSEVRNDPKKRAEQIARVGKLLDKYHDEYINLDLTKKEDAARAKDLHRKIMTANRHYKDLMS